MLISAWEYKILNVGLSKGTDRFYTGECEKDLNALGKDGWELTAVICPTPTTPMFNSFLLHAICFLRRPVNLGALLDAQGRREVANA